MSYTIGQETLYKALGELVDRIEVCGASVELTNAVILASDLRRAIGNEYKRMEHYSGACFFFSFSCVPENVLVTAGTREMFSAYSARCSADRCAYRRTIS